MSEIRKIAILLHHNDIKALRTPYIIWVLKQAWEDWGIEVQVVHGIDHPIQADIVFCHIDLTIYPKDYIEFLSEYPCVVNGAVPDISKRSFSDHLVDRNDDYSGPVIVKTNLNNGGRPELRLAEGPPVRRSRIGNMLDRMKWRIAPRHSLIHANTLDPTCYPIFPSATSVPDGVFENEALVVERFLPEVDGEYFVLRNYVFLGDGHSNSRKTAPNPIVKAAIVIDREVVPVSDAIVFRRKQLGVDYGKFDYGVRAGRAVLYDVNRTPTFASKHRKRTEGLDRIANGIRSLFEGVHRKCAPD